jgi:hypothetical protein
MQNSICCLVLLFSLIACETSKSDNEPITTHEKFYDKLYAPPQPIPNTYVPDPKDEIVDLNYTCKSLKPNNTTAFYAIISALGGRLNDNQEHSVAEIKEIARRLPKNYIKQREDYYDDFNDGIDPRCYLFHGDTCFHINNDYSGYYVPLKYVTHLLRK